MYITGNDAWPFMAVKRMNTGRVLSLRTGLKSTADTITYFQGIPIGLICLNGIMPVRTAAGEIKRR